MYLVSSDDLLVYGLKGVGLLLDYNTLFRYSYSSNDFCLPILVNIWSSLFLHPTKLVLPACKISTRNSFLEGVGVSRATHVLIVMDAALGSTVAS